MQDMHVRLATHSGSASILDALTSRDATLIGVAFTREAREVIGRLSHKIRQTVPRDNHLAVIGACRPSHDGAHEALIEQACTQGIECLIEHEQATLTGYRPLGGRTHKLERMP